MIDQRCILHVNTPGHPVPCERARVFADKRTGAIRAARPAKTASYEKTVGMMAQIAANRAKWQCVPGEYVVWIDIYRKAKQGDFDNYAKAQIDPMRAIVFPNDHMIVEAHIRLFIDKLNERAEVTIERRVP